MGKDNTATYIAVTSTVNSMSAADQELTVRTSSESEMGTPLPEYKLLDSGVKVPILVDEEWIKAMKDMKLRPSDVWVVSFPKSGTTWTMQIVRLINNGGKNDGKILSEVVPWVEAFNSTIPGFEHINVDEMACPRAFKSHFPYDSMPCGPPNTKLSLGKYIYVVRNPKDVVVSFFHHINAIPFVAPVKWDEYFERFIQGDVAYGNYFDHVLSWWAHKDDDNILILKYEDMKKDLPSVVAQVAKFIGKDISKELVDEIARKTTFVNMKEDSSANFEWMCSDHRSNQNPYVRKGEVGGWKSFFTSEQNARMDAIYRKRLTGTGLDLEFQ